MMILHYTKMAIRNLRKYALQNTVSILGLALGFVALSLSAYWYRFDTTYDKFHKDWERLYLLTGSRTISSDNFTSFPIDDVTYKTLMEMPETESVVKCYHMSDVLAIDREFFNMMGFEIIKGDTSFLEKPGYCAISETFAIKNFGKKDPIGEKIEYLDGEVINVKNNDINYHEISYYNNYSECTVGAVYRGNNHSYLDFDIMIKASKAVEVDYEHFNMVFVKLCPGVDPIAYEKAILSNIQGTSYASKIQLCNVSKLHSLYNTGPMNIKQLRVFAFISILLMVCAVVSFITLFVSKISGRRKEMGLRLSNGSSRSGLLSLLSIEMFLQFLIALIVAVIFVFFIKDKFSEYTRIGGNTIYIVLSSLFIMVSVLILSVAVGMITINFILKGSLSSTMTSNRSLNMIIRRSGLSIQLFISITCLFCSLSMFHQLSFMRNANWGFSIRGIASIVVSAYLPIEEIGADYNSFPYDKLFEIAKEASYKLSDSLNKMPGVIEANPSDYSFSRQNTSGYSLYLSPNTDSISNRVTDLSLFDIGNESYGFSVLEGSLPKKELAADEIVISECVCRAFGLENPIGKKLYKENWRTGGFESFNIVAVVSDIYLKGPFADPDPVIFIPKSTNSLGKMVNYNVLVRYNNDVRKELSELTDSFFVDSKSRCEITYMEDWFAKFMKPSNDLFKIFSIISIVCMLIAVSGVYSIITLTCQERRREIAVRKVHGAKVRDILTIFVREYGAVLLMTSVVAFGVGYVVMHKWLQQFQKQAVISWWIYAVILLGMAAIICLTVVQRIVKTARENPADVIKSE